MTSLWTTLSVERKKQISIWIFLVIAAAAVAFVFDQRDSNLISVKPEAEDPETAATFIPAGFVLVPIEVANYESLDSILGKFGVVDLYTVPLEPKDKPKKVAERVKILRAPLNPNHFAVLSREEDSQTLVGTAGPFTVVVQNPNRMGTGIVIAKGTSSPASDSKTSGASERKRLSRVTIEVMNADNSPTSN